MAKSQTQDAQKKADDLSGQAQSQTAPIIQGLQGSVAQQTQNQGDTYNSLSPSLKEHQTTGGYDSTQLNTIRNGSAGNAATGGYNPDEIAGLKASGGYDPGMLQSIQSGAGAGYDPTAEGTVTGGYSDFAKNGGFDDAAKTNYMNQATQGVGATSRALQEQAKLATTKTGGFGGAGAVAQIARQLGQTQSEATVNAESGLNTAINSNKLAGLGGLDKSQATQAALKQSGAGILAGVAGNQAGNRVGLAESEAGNKLKGTDQQIGIESGVAAGSTAADNAMNQLYSTETGQITAQGQQALQALGLQFNSQAESINALTQLSKNPGMFQTIFGDIVAGAGAVAGIGKAMPGGLNHNQVIL